MSMLVCVCVDIVLYMCILTRGGYMCIINDGVGMCVHVCVGSMCTCICMMLSVCVSAC